MRLIADVFALIGLCATIIVASAWVGYTTYQPKCRTIAAVFTEHCK